MCVCISMCYFWLLVGVCVKQTSQAKPIGKFCSSSKKVRLCSCIIQWHKTDCHVPSYLFTSFNVLCCLFLKVKEKVKVDLYSALL